MKRVKSGSIPLDRQGKIDRDQLVSLHASQSTTARKLNTNVAPRTAQEHLLVKLWSEVLGISKLGIHDNFFEIGGDSIKAIQVVSRLRSYEFKAEIRHLFENPTIAEFALTLTVVSKTVEQALITGVVPLTPIQHWLFEDFNGAPHHMNQAILLDVQGRMDAGLLEQALQKLLEHHDALRMSYAATPPEVVQENRASVPFKLEIIDLEGHAEPATAIRNEGNRLQSSFKLEQGGLVKAALLRLNNHDKLLLVIHHLVIDGVSWRILFEDLTATYQQLQQDKSVTLPLKTDAFKAWAEDLQAYSQSEALAQEQAYWETIVNTSVPALPAIESKHKSLHQNSRTLSTTLNAEATRHLLTGIHHIYNTQINDVLLTALAQVMHGWHGGSQTLITLESHGRDRQGQDLDITRTVGWFTSMYPVLLALEVNSDTGTALKTIKETLRQIPNNGIGYGVLKYLRRTLISPTNTPRITFNYLGQFDTDLSGTPFSFAPEYVGDPVAPDSELPHDLSFYGVTRQQQLTLYVNFDPARFSPDTVQALLEGYQQALLGLIQHCQTQTASEVTPHDLSWKQLNLKGLQQLLTSAGLKAHELQDVYPLSPLQSGMLYEHLYAPDSASYHIQLAFQSSGQVNLAVFEQAWNQLLQRHDILRTVFWHEEQDQPLQLVLKQRALKVGFYDWRQSDPATHAAQLEVFCAQDRAHTFDISRDILVRFNIIQIANERFYMVWSFHHIILDGWCSGIIYRELLQLYKGLLEQQPAQLVKAIPYATYIQWLEQQDKQAAEHFWSDYLAGFEAQTGLPRLPNSDLSLPPTEGSSEHHYHDFVFDSALTQQLQQLASQHQVTLYTVLCALWGVLLAKYNNTLDIVFGTTVAGRPEEIEGVENILGLFINTLPNRVRMTPEMTLAQLFQTLHADNSKAQAYHHYPLHRIQANTSLRQHLFDHLVVFENFPLGASVKQRNSEFPYFQVDSSDVFEQISYDFGLLITPAEQIDFRFEYNPALYPSSLMHSVEQHLRTLASHFIQQPNESLSSISLLDEAEAHKILIEWNSTRELYPEQLCVHQFFEAQVERTPDAVALIVGEEHISYRELNQRANQLAHYLRAQGVGLEMPVGVFMPRTANMLVALLGVLKSGGAYVPLDPNYPEQRVQYMLNNAGVNTLITTSTLLNQVTTLKADRANLHCVLLDNYQSSIAQYPNSNPINITQVSHRAYILYTSGSTGLPKGIEIEHRVSSNLVNWGQRFHTPAELRGVLFSTSICFDVSLYEMYIALGSGGALILAENALELPHLPHANKVTLISTVPSAARELVNNGAIPDSVQAIVLAGEFTPVDLVNHLYQSTSLQRVCDGYGPMEANYCTITVRQAEHRPDIGRPVPNASLYILDPEHNPVPVGVVGEIYIGGLTLARGYFNNPEATANKFISNPFPTSPQVPNSGRLYQTGDLGRFLPDGRVEYLGRVDHQVKIRGFRIELGEIEEVLSHFPHLVERVVVARTPAEGSAQLVAYIVMGVGELRTQAELADALRRFVTQYLPDYMIPAHFVRLDSLPKTPNGKVDRNQLPDPVANQRESTAPRNAIEQTLVAIWSQVLGISSLSIHDNFFELGGDSIKAIQVIAKLAHAQLKCEMRHFIHHPTIAMLAPLLADQANTEHQPVVQEQVSGSVPLTPIQHWFSRDIKGPKHHINNAVMLYPKAPLNAEALQQAFQSLMDHHDALRLTIELNTDNTVKSQYNQVSMEFKLEVKTIADPSNGELETYADTVHTQFNLAQGPLLKAVLFRLPDSERLLIVAHHLVIDGVSWRILFDDLMRAYQQLLAQQPVKLPLKTVSFKAWAKRLQSLSLNDALFGEVTYWQQLLHTPCQPLPLKPSLAPSLVRHSLTHTIEFSEAETRSLLSEIHHAYNTRINDILLTGLALALSQWHGGQRSLVAVESHGRDFPAAGLDIARTVGWFTALFPVLLELAEQPDLGEQIKQIKENLRAIPSNGVGYGILKYLTHELDNLPSAQISFNYLGQFDQDLSEESLFGFAKESSGLAGSPDSELTYELVFSGMIKYNRLRLAMAFDPAQLAAQQAEQLLESYKIHLLSLVSFCKARKTTESTPSDLNNGVVTLPTVTINTAERYEPFPLSEIQQAYWVGRSGNFELGNVSTYSYIELNCTDLDLEHFQHVWQRMIERHEMLRMIILPNGQQRILPEVPIYQLPVINLRDQAPHQIEYALNNLRETMSHQVVPADRWPLFDIRASLIDEHNTILHLGLDALIADAWGMRLLARDLLRMYHHPERPLETLELSFRDYILTEQELQKTPWYQNSFNYWRKRLDNLAPAPSLPMVKQPSSLTKTRFVRRAGSLTVEQWQRMKSRASGAGLTPSGLLLAAFGEILGYWSKDPRLTINLTIFNRLPLHPQVNSIAGDFTSLILVEVNRAAKTNFLEYAREVQQQLWQDLEHRHVNGVRVLRELIKKRGNQQSAAMPVVFTSTLTLNNFEDPERLPALGDPVFGIGQTPQVWLDHQVSEEAGCLRFDWDAVDELFPAHMLDDMFAMYSKLLHQLAEAETDWSTMQVTVLPPWQRDLYQKVNHTTAPAPATLLHTLFLDQVKRTPNAIAVIIPERQLSYSEVEQRAIALAWQLHHAGATPNTLVAVVMPKGWEQVVAVYGILLAGAAYLPIDPEQPQERQHYLLQQGEAKLVVTLPILKQQLSWPDQVKCLTVADDPLPAVPLIAPATLQKPTDLAYVIFTSGSTGQPKGVMIDHRGVVNTILDINQRYKVTAQDRVLGLSALNFDLSVYDIFGLLAVGGALVLPVAGRERDVAHWLELMNQHQVTLWNTVPALMQLMADYLVERPELPRQANLRVGMLSGDWIPLSLPDKIHTLWPAMHLNSLGGATEASIWSIHYPITHVDSEWRSIPYGKPLLNQTFYVLNARMELCPVWTQGSLYIGGIGLALGYWRDEVKTNASFVTHPQTGERLYKTGDLGRYLPDGNIEFLGREDFQVKLHGYRIELGEIEAALQQHPKVQDAVVTVVERQQLAAYIIPKPAQQDDYQADNAGEVILDKVARLEFKLRQPSIRHQPAQSNSVQLPKPVFDEALTAAYLARQSYREFNSAPIELAEFSQLLSSLVQMPVAGAPLPKYRYPSAGNLYPVQTYISVRPERIKGLAGGIYYYHPAEHRLDLITAGEGIDSSAYGAQGGFNQRIYEQSAFAIFLIGKLDAIRPLYGELARDFCLLEAGYMSQLLMEVAPDYGLGLCPIGNVEFESQQALFQLGADHILVHSLLGGAINAAQTQQWMQDSHQQQASSADQLKEFLQHKLPAYMIPTHYVVLEQFPLSANGKVDRKALPLPDMEPLEESKTGYEVPATALEQQIAELWQEILALTQIGSLDNFFSLGGDSLLAIRLLTRLREVLPVDITLRDLYEAPQLCRFAQRLESRMPAPIAPQGDSDDYIVDEI